MEIGMVLFEY